MARQYIRKISLVVGDAQGQGRDLANLACTFNVRHSIIETPNTLIARVYNMNDATRNSIINEYTRIILQAGYEGNFGTIFKGEIKQVFRGRESAVDEYLDIYAADSDLAHNWAVINTSLAAGWTPDMVYDQVANSMTKFQIDAGTKPDELANGPAAPRGKVMFGMSRDEARSLAQSHNMTWSLDQGTLSFIPQSAYKPGEAVVISDTTGMIGVPQQTMDGITVTVLLNPSIGVGTLIKITPPQAVSGFARSGPAGLNYTSTDLPTTIDSRGQYKVLFVDHVGETRGNPWYTQITCSSTDPTAIQPNSRAVLGAGA